jgi:2-polyprenyl-6-hydroxyphenyl methylase/3-demethylubiquinone-9 3-methyltransferase
MSEPAPASPTGLAHAEDLARGERFAFGANWARFLSVLDDDRIAEAEKSLRENLRVADLRGRTFLDIGSGSGLFSLAARRLGARVRSFDFDPRSVACTAELRRRYFPDDPEWTVGEGSVLDADFLRGLGPFDVVYSWGVLHHTGDQWRALEHAQGAVAPGGSLYIALYNDQGARSRLWRRLKRWYCSGPFGRGAVTALGSTYFFAVCLKEDLLRGRNPLARYREYRRQRGMSVWHDWVDWFGGYPFEVSRPGEVVDFLVARGFVLTRLLTVGGALGCNEYVFRRI